MEPLNLQLIDGVIKTPLKQILDERGGVFHILRKSDEGFLSFGEAYISKVNAGRVKAWKYHKEMTQNFCVPFGKLKLVLFDDRENSPTRGLINQFHMDDNENYIRITIPPKIWYGFKCISSKYCLLLNLANIPHSINESISTESLNKDLKYLWDE